MESKARRWWFAERALSGRARQQRGRLVPVGRTRAAGRVILGCSDGIETGVLQLRRSRPLEVTELEVPVRRLRVPTDAEMLRVKAWMIVHRNATRDVRDVAALADRLGLARAGATLAAMDYYYADQREGGRG